MPLISWSLDASRGFRKICQRLHHRCLSRCIRGPDCSRSMIILMFSDKDRTNSLSNLHIWTLTLGLEKSNSKRLASAIQFRIAAPCCHWQSLLTIRTNTYRMCPCSHRNQYSVPMKRGFRCGCMLLMIDSCHSGCSRGKLPVLRFICCELL